MQQLSIIQQTQAVDNWYRDAKVYRYGSREQQVAKFYRTLGEIAEGVQKMDGLKVAAAMGRSIWTFVGLLHFGKHTNVGDFVIPLDTAIKERGTGGTREARLQGLFVVATEMVGIIQQDEYDAHGYITELHVLARQYQMLARICGLEFDRVINNGLRVLINKKGEMNVMGMFVAASDDFTGDKLTGAFKGAETPSGPGIYVIIINALQSCISALVAPYHHRPFNRKELPKINTELANTLHEVLEMYVHNSVRWNSAVFERAPAMIATYANGNLGVAPNEDLLYLFECLKKDNDSNETIS
ncbi:TPA: hypothetical protein ACTPQ1_004728 [Salmonella enterica]